MSEDAMSAEQQKQPARPEYWSTLSEYHRDEEYLERAGEEFHPGAKPERYYEAGEDSEPLVSPMKRRTFLKLGGFATLAAMIQGCERPVQKVLPYVSKPEEVAYGVSNYYASTLSEGMEGLGLLINTREGRPIKLEGNPDHPINSGTLDARAQAALLDLYNPDRLRFPMRINRRFEGEVGDGLKRGDHPPVEVLDGEIGEAIANARGKVVLLTPTVHGPANERLIEDFEAQGENFVHVAYDSLVTGFEREANRVAFGVDASPRYVLENADVVVALGGDPLGQGSSPVESHAGFAKRRSPKHPDGMSRVFAFEPHPTLTGMQADYRSAVRPEDLPAIGLAIANLLLYGEPEYAVPSRDSLAGNDSIRGLLSDYTAVRVARDTGVDGQAIRRAARNLAEHPGRSLVSTESLSAAGSQGLSLALVGNFLNYILGNYENTIDLYTSPSRQARSTASGILGLIGEMEAGNVDVLIFHGVNPVYTLPASTGFARAMGKVKLAVSLDRMMNETAARSDIAIPAVHGLESWGDAEPQHGVLSIQQPAIRPIFGELAKNATYFTRPWQESVMKFLGASGRDTFLRKPSDQEVQEMVAAAGVESRSELDPVQLEPKPLGWMEYLRETWRVRVYTGSDFAARDFENFWSTVLRRGVIDRIGTEARRGPFPVPDMQPDALARISPPAKTAARVLVAYPSPYHGDGQSMANPHLLELPDPASKVAWDNYAAVSPALARELKVKDGDHVKVAAGGEDLVLPVYTQPGTHEGVVAVMLGWGRNTFGGIGDGLGADVRPLLSVENGQVVYAGLPVTIEKMRGRTPLADVQGHNYLYSPSYAGIMVNKQHGDIQEGAQLNEKGEPVYDRPIVGETTWKEWQEDPYSGYPNHTEHGKTPKSMWQAKHKYQGHHWGMSVDLNACTGCNACIVACSIENNVPVVGKEEVLMGREMHWIRIDRYYRGEESDPDFVSMPVMCQHCDNAPCETVCPVIATMHNDEGLNVMTYNRCVGTRYCANNCPYKVRRFNFWQYTDYRTGPHDGHKRVAPLELVLNPDVTTRTRGVMEKCTFCVARIRNAKEEARSKGRPLQDGEMKTACQQTCPAQAIQFGDRNDPNAEIAQSWKDPRAYGLLEDLNTDPSVRYMTLVRNREEPSPYRTKYQSHRMEHGAHGEGHEDTPGGEGHGEGAAQGQGYGEEY